MDERLIYDVGMHKGEDSEFYLKKGFRVIALEANPSLCAYSQERLRPYLSDGSLTVVNAAIAEKNGPIRFLINDDASVWGTTSEDWALRNEKFGTASRPITVDGVRFEEIIQKFGVPYFLKIDIEGADLLCLKGLLEFEAKPRYVSIESTKTSWAALTSEFDLFKTLGYSKFKVVGQKNVRRQSCPFPAREGQFVDYRFEAGASGLFGEEAPGQWMSDSEALATYRRIFKAYQLYGDDATARRICRSILGKRLANRLPAAQWYDTHATR